MTRTLTAALALLLLLSSVPGAPAARAQEKTVAVGMSQEPDRLLAPRLLVGTLAQNLVYDALVAVDDRMQPFPVLAADIPTLENGGARFVGTGPDRFLRVTMPLRAGITWSDGTPFTADDVVYMFGVIMNPGSGFDTTQEEKIKAVSKLDDYTVQFDYLSANEARAKDAVQYADQGSDPVVDPRYFFGFNVGNNVIYPRHRLAELLGDDPVRGDFARVLESDLARNPVGTGPYRLAAWEPGAAMTFQSRGEALPQRQGRPNIDSIVLRFMPSRAAALAALEAGALQVVTQDALEAGDSGDLALLQNARAESIQGTMYEQLTLNLRNPILADPAVRQAIAYGLDRQQMVDVLLSGRSEPLQSQVPPWSWAYTADVTSYPYNPAEADRLLTQSGWVRPPGGGIREKQGQRLSLRLFSTGTGFRSRSLPLIKAQLARVGIDVSLETVAPEELFDPRASTPRSLTAGQFDLAEFAWSSAFDPGELLRYTNYSGNIPRPDRGYAGGNYAAYRNDRVDQLLDQGQASLEQGFRRMAYGEAQQILARELPLIPLFPRPITIAYANSMVNVRASLSASGETWNVEQWDIQ